MDIDARRTRLIAWLEVIKDDVPDLMLDHHVFWEVQAILKANPKVTKASGLFIQWMASSFVQSAAVGVRRQAKGGDDSVSLKRVLDEVRQYPELISRQFYLAFVADSPEWLTEQWAWTFRFPGRVWRCVHPHECRRSTTGRTQHRCKRNRALRRSSCRTL